MGTDELAEGGLSLERARQKKKKERKEIERMKAGNR
jgi:hypothetical protein